MLLIVGVLWIRRRALCRVSAQPVISGSKTPRRKEDNARWNKYIYRENFFKSICSRWDEFECPISSHSFQIPDKLRGISFFVFPDYTCIYEQGLESLIGVAKLHFLLSVIVA